MVTNNNNFDFEFEFSFPFHLATKKSTEINISTKMKKTVVSFQVDSNKNDAAKKNDHQRTDLPQALLNKETSSLEQSQKADLVRVVVPFSRKVLRVNQQRRKLCNKQKRLESIYKHGALVETKQGKFIQLVGTERARKAILRGKAKKVQCHNCQTYH